MRKLIIYIAYSVGLWCYDCSAYLDTISELAAYASKIPSDTPNQSVEPYHTRFRKFHKAIPSLTETSFFSRFWFGENRVVTEFKGLLDRVAKRRELKGYYGDFVQKFYIEDETKWYIWGALHGAFHSLVRGLAELKKYKYIDDNLVLLNANTYLVFNGNMINYGPYQIETLLVMLKLAEKNPLRVVLIKGAFEQEGAWQKTNLRDELRTRIGAFGKEIPMEKEIRTLFNTFALASYLISTEGDVVRISFYDKHPLLQEDEWSDFFKKKVTEVRKLKYISPHPIERLMKTRISTHAVKEVPYNIHGLAYEKDGDVNAWAVFSSPLNIFRAYFNFYEDVSIQLTTGRYFSSWLLTLFSQDPNNPKGFVRAREFELATGKEIYTADPAKRIQDLSEQIELAEIEKKHLQSGCKKQKNKESSESKLNVEKIEKD